jgi:hypothetical protein
MERSLECEENREWYICGRLEEWLKDGEERKEEYKTREGIISRRDWLRLMF